MNFALVFYGLVTCLTQRQSGATDQLGARRYINRLGSMLQRYCGTVLPSNMAVTSAVVLLALVAGVFSSCSSPGYLENFDRTKLVGNWTVLWWPKEYTPLYKCGVETFTVDGNHNDYEILEYDIARENITTITGIIRQIKDSGKFIGTRDNWDNLIWWYVLGFEEDKWISYLLCVEEIVHRMSFVLKKEGAILTPEELLLAERSRPFPPDYYDSNCIHF